MPTKRPRLNVTLSAEVWALVNEVHKFTGTPKSAIVSEILDEIAPVFQTQIQALRILHESPREAQRLMQDFASDSVGKLMNQQLELSKEFDALDARTVKGKRAKKGGIRGRTP